MTDFIGRKAPLSPLAFIFIICAAVFASESLSMSVVFAFGPFPSRWIEALLDSFILLIFLSPFLYLFVFRPMLHHIDERRKAEESLVKDEQTYRTLVDSTEDSIYVMDRNYRYIFINKIHLSRLGINGDQYVGRSYGDYHSGDVTKAFTAIIDTVFDTGESIRYEHKSERDNEFFLLSISPVRQADGEISAVTVVSKKISELKLLEKELRELSLTDDLTGLYNRRGLSTLAEQHIKIAARQKNKLFLLFADLDNLKHINDTFGHSTGDSALRESAEILRETFRDSDIIARVGGDEFIVIPIGTTQAAAERIAARLQESLRARNARGDRGYDLSISCGISYYDPEHPCSIDELLIQADKSMYAHKKSKKE